MKKQITKLPANESPDSIKNVVSIVRVIGNRGLGFADVESHSLDGTVEEKLKQYKEITGKDWSGYGERTFSVVEKVEPVTLALGTKPPDLLPCNQKATDDANAKIAALVEQAEVWLAENEEAKTRTKLITALSEKNTVQAKA